MKVLNKILSAVLIVGALCGFANANGGPREMKTIVLVHGAFADGTGSWLKVIPVLRAKGYKVVAVQTPLTSLADDVATVKRALDLQTGNVVLVGHSWGGAVITQAGIHDKVTELVYVAGFAPDVGQSVADVTAPYPTPPGFGNLVVDPAGFASLNNIGMTNDFAQDLPADQTDLMFVTQGPISLTCFTDKVTDAAWKTKPSWYVVAENDRMIQPDLERAFAANMKATTTSVASSHVPMLSKPDDIANAIMAAADHIAK
jgi:pimeloyl-ACP methyl ester carboxylesterase